MRRTTTRVAAAAGSTAVLAIAFAVPSVAHAADTPGRHTVSAKPDWSARAARTGAVSGSSAQQFKVVLNLRNEAGAEALARSVSDPHSAQYRKFVSAAQWRARFAPTNAQVKQVADWLKSQGLKVGQIPANHRYVMVSGSTSAVNTAFNTTISHFNYQGQVESAPATALSVPAPLGSLVAGVSGLDSTARSAPLSTTGSTDSVSTDSKQTPAKAKTDETLPPPPAVFKNAGPCSAYYGQKVATDLPKLDGVSNPMPYAPCGYKPAQIRGAYGADQALSTGYDGRGATVAIIDAYASPTIYSDASTYAKKNDPSHPLRGYQFAQSLPATYTHTGTGKNDCGASGWYGEETLDVEAVHATAPAANILYVGATSCYNADLNAAMNSIVDNSLAQVISNSYGSSGEPTSLADVTDEHQTFLQAAAQGISVLFSSGDDGDNVVSTGKRQVDYEASDPYVTAVGGTSLMINADNSYGGEQGWGTGKSTLKSGAWTPVPPAYVYGGGGGTSQLFKQPGYQKSVVPSSISNYFGQGAHRAVPDVAMLGDPNTGFLVGQTQTFPNGKAKYSEYRIGGTSLSSPLFAGEVAIADQYAGGSLGFLNPRIYRLAGTSAFTDVDHTGVTDAVVRVDFLNGVDQSGGLNTTARTLNQTGTIFTRKGYDDVTGVGTPNGLSFFAGMATGKAPMTSGGGGGVKN